MDNLQPDDSPAVTEGFALPEARGLIQNLLQPSPSVYWPDFFVSTTLSYGFIYLYLATPAFSPWNVVGFVIGGFAVFRAATFIHEIVHLRRGTLPGFTLAWNLLIGIPLLTPSYFYDNHHDHHSRKHYGTPMDGEYLPLANSPTRELLLYALQVLLIPALAVGRFVVLTPLSYLSPRIRRWTDRCASSYVSNPYYKKAPDAPTPSAVWRLAEFAVFALYTGLLTLATADVVPWAILSKLYVLACFGIGLNWLRNLAGHTFRNTGAPMSHVQQFEDSITVIGNPVVCELLFPLGLRYHALHHLFPAMPYHALGLAHRRLMTQLSPASLAAYKRTIYHGLTPVLKQLWLSARDHGDLRPMAVWRKGAQIT